MVERPDRARTGGDGPPVVAHTIIPYLPKSGSWVHSQLTRLSRYRAIVVTKRIENRETFPFEPVFSNTDLSPLANLRNRLGKRRHGYFPSWRRTLEEQGARLIHSHFGDWGYEDVSLKLATGLPQVSSFYGADIWLLGMIPEWQERYRHYFAHGDRFLVEGNAMRNRVMELGCLPEKVLIHHLGVDLERIEFHPRRLGDDGVVRFLAAGRMAPTKGHDLSVRAFARVHRKNPRTQLGLILITHPGRREADLEPVTRAIREEGVGDAVTVHGYMPYPEYLAALRSYHVFLQPSRQMPNGDAEGGAPVGMIEMSASGMPVVGSVHCDIPEVILDGRTGLLFPERDVDAMAERMLQLADTPQSWGDYAAAARAHIETEYNVVRQAPRLESIYDALLESSGPESVAPSERTNSASTASSQ